jgi:hypothetical protein
VSWLKWILAYLFGCVHTHTTWPHQDRAGLAYVCCIDCGRELPYSVQQMKIVTSQEPTTRSLRNCWDEHSSVRRSTNLSYSRTRSGVVIDASPAFLQGPHFH